jgi:hypothetical protein
MKKLLALAAIVLALMVSAFAVITQRERERGPERNAVRERKVEPEWEDYRLVGVWVKENQPFSGLITEYTKDSKVFDWHVNGGVEEYKYHLKGEKLLYYLKDGRVFEGKLNKLTDEDLVFNHPNWDHATWTMKKRK